MRTYLFLNKDSGDMWARDLGFFGLWEVAFGKIIPWINVWRARR